MENLDEVLFDVVLSTIEEMEEEGSLDLEDLDIIMVEDLDDLIKDIIDIWRYEKVEMTDEESNDLILFTQNCLDDLMLYDNLVDNLVSIVDFAELEDFLGEEVSVEFIEDMLKLLHKYI